MALAMFGPRLSTVFASRWRALWFAGATLMTAYCAIPHDPPDSTAQNPVNASSAAAEAQSVIDQSGLTAQEKAQAEAALKALSAL